MHAAEKVFVEDMFTLSTKAMQIYDENNDDVEDTNKQVAANDPGGIFLLANCYFKALDGFPQDQLKAIELFSRAADLGFSKAHHSHLGMDYYEVRDMKKAKFHTRPLLWQ
jgi:TPR repeat protein